MKVLFSWLRDFVDVPDGPAEIGRRLSLRGLALEGIEPAKYDQILGLEKQGLTTAVAAAAGYRAATDKYALAKKVRFQKSEVLKEV
mgnify:CR=1 FL=1